MKKIVSLLLVTIMLISCISLLSSCDTGSKNNIDTEGIEQVITHIESNELNKALSKCQSLNQETLENSKDAILECILKNLEYYLEYDNWTNTKYALVDTKAIDELKIYKKILNLLPLEDTFTNASTFVSTALKLEKFIEWNDYYKSNDDYLTEAMEYMNQGAPYRNTSWSIAVTYYEKAYTVSNSAYNYFKNSDEKGMQEAAEWYKVLSEEIKRTINKQDSTAAQDNAYSHASASYKQMVNEYISVLSDVIDIIDTFPKNLY